MINTSTLTTRFAAIQVKLLHLQFRMKKIHEDQEALSISDFKTNRDRIRGMLPSAYTVLDMLVSLENVAALVRDMFATPELRRHFDDDVRRILNQTKKTAEKWRPVRNKLGGHIDVKVVDGMCVRHGFRGVFLSNDLECDVAVLNMLLLEAAVNAVRPTSDIFGRDLDMRSDLPSEVGVLVNALNDDWNAVFSYFTPLMELMYGAGKQEKINSTRPSERAGIVTGE